jgi:hypothetical protein
MKDPFSALWVVSLPITRLMWLRKSSPRRLKKTRKICFAMPLGRMDAHRIDMATIEQDLFNDAILTGACTVDIDGFGLVSETATATLQAATKSSGLGSHITGVSNYRARL